MEIFKISPTYTAQIDASDAEKGIYDHYMLKEINEQPAVMRRIIQEYEDENGDLNIDSEIIKDVSNASHLYYCCRNKLSCWFSW